MGTSHPYVWVHKDAEAAQVWLDARAGPKDQLLVLRVRDGSIELVEIEERTRYTLIKRESE